MKLLMIIAQSIFKSLVESMSMFISW